MLLLQGFWSSEVFNTVATTAQDVVGILVLLVFRPLLCVCVFNYACVGLRGWGCWCFIVCIFVGWSQPLPRKLCVLVECVVSIVYRWSKNKGSSAAERCMGRSLS